MSADPALAVARWVQSFVVDLGLCPFARRPLQTGGVALRLSQASDPEVLLADLQAACEELDAHPEIATTLLIHPRVLTDFYEYNQFLDRAEDTLAALGYSGTYQIASFHPQYQFAGTDVDDAENYSNRTPYPLLHLLREADLSDALAHYPDSESIPDRNIDRLRRLGRDVLVARLQSCSV